jgi:thiamine biosynthesis protein thiS
VGFLRGAFLLDAKEAGMIIVNGEEFEIDSGSSVAKLVEERGLDRSRVAVELNGEIVPRGTFDDTLLHDGDKVEIVHFVGGG